MRKPLPGETFSTPEVLDERTPFLGDLMARMNCDRAIIDEFSSLPAASKQADSKNQ